MGPTLLPPSSPCKASYLHALSRAAVHAVPQPTFPLPNYLLLDLYYSIHISFFTVLMI
jgi:hypothetical protein